MGRLDNEVQECGDGQRLGDSRQVELDQGMLGGKGSESTAEFAGGNTS